MKLPPPETTAFEAWVEGRVPVLKTYVQRLLTLSSEVLNQLHTNNEDHLGVMGICFLRKQLEHLNAIMLLGPHRDSELIARSMLEGLAQFIWAVNGGQERARRWRDFGHIQNLRQLRNDPNPSATPHPGFQQQVENNVQSFGNTFYSKIALKKEERGEPLPDDPFAIDWTCMSVKELFGQVESYGQLYRYYIRFSEWHHWSFAGLARALDITGPSIRYKPESTVSAAQALVVGFQCLFQTCELADKHFELSFGQRLGDLRKEYLRG